MTSDALAPQLRDAFLAALLAKDGTRARHLVECAVDDGVAVPDLYLGVLQPALEEVGARWARGELGIASEHYATTVTRGIVGALGEKMRIHPRGGRLAVVASTLGDQHVLAPQMVADFLEAAGWEVLPLGDPLPDDDLVQLVEDERPDVVALSTTLPDALPAARRTLTRLRTAEPSIFIVVGGRAWAGESSVSAVGAGADVQLSTPKALVGLLAERFPPLPEDQAA